MIVTTRTPLRISFFGGGTDLLDYYGRDYGAVVSTTIAQYVYVTAKPHGSLFDEKFRLNYSKTEEVMDLADIENDIARESIRLSGIDEPLYVSTVADLPSGSGLGSSSSFAVGLLHALSVLNGHRISPGELGNLACRIEIDILKKPIGKQDQFAAAYGGLNHFRFDKNGLVSMTPISLQPELRDALFQSFILFWTGIARKAEDVLSDQKSRTQHNMGLLDEMRSIADEAVALLGHPTLSVRTFGELLHASWLLKDRLSSRISNDRLRTWYEKAIAAGAHGGKLCGAGGGGFLLFCAPPERHAAIKAALGELRSVEVAYDPLGTRVLFPGYNVVEAVRGFGEPLLSKARPSVFPYRIAHEH